MTASLRLKENYTLARCCHPDASDGIIGYYSHDNVLRVHRMDCPNLAKAEPERLVNLSWNEILDRAVPFTPDEGWAELEDGDFAVLAHHERFGVDYSLLVARKLGIPKTEAFARHAKLRSLGLLTRVEPTMIQYRKGIVDGTWIKHRNHTYYALTEEGRACLRHRREASGNDL